VKDLHRPLAASLTALAIAALVGCGGADPAEQIQSAKKHLAQDENRSAVIELKSMLQDHPDSPEGRFLLGKALLASGDAVGAIVELRKASDLHYDENLVTPELARALMATGDFQRLTEQFGQTHLSDNLAEADLKVTLARTYGGLGRREQSKQAAEAALQAVPDYGPANVFMARLRADTGDFAGAVAALDTQLQRTPQDYEGWQVRGELLFLGLKKYDEALESYRQSIKIRPNYVQAHSGALTLLLARHDVEGAKAQLAELKKVLPNHPQTLYFEGNVDLLAKDVEAAHEVVLKLLRMAPDNARVLQLAGAVEFERHNWLAAETQLAKAVQKSPNMDVARRLLALTYLQRGDAEKALSTIQPLLEQPNPSAALYSIKGRALVMAGEFDAADEAFRKANEINPDDTSVQTVLALGKIAKGDANAGIAELQNLSAKGETSLADLALISTLLRNKDFDGALKTVDRLAEKMPDSPIPSNLRGRVLLAKGDRAGATTAFEETLKRDPKFFPAAAALAQLALADNQLDLAKQRIDAVLAADPGNSRALIASAGLLAKSGAPKEQVLKLVNEAVDKAPQDATPRLFLINYQMGNKDLPGALDTARKAVAAIPDAPALVEALGRVQAASGDTNQAIQSFNKLAQMLPESAAPYLRLADVQWSARNLDGTVAALKRALSVEPESLQAQKALIDVYLAQDNPREAVQVAKNVQKQRPKQAAGYLLEGGVYSSQRNWKDAIAVYRSGLAAVPESSETAIRLYSALLAAGDTAAAERQSADWLKAHPQDAAFHYQLGDTSLARKEFGKAEQHYRDVLRIQPNNALALNNVAWLMAQTKQPGAVKMAEKALALMPDRPAVMDTLALALASEGQAAKGVEVLRKALAIQSGNPQLRLNLAKMLIQTGDKPGAKVELDQLAALGDRYPQQAEVQQLLKTL